MSKKSKRRQEYKEGEKLRYPNLAEVSLLEHCGKIITIHPPFQVFYGNKQANRGRESFSFKIEELWSGFYSADADGEDLGNPLEKITLSLGRVCCIITGNCKEYGGASTFYGKRIESVIRSRAVVSDT